MLQYALEIKLEHLISLPNGLHSNWIFLMIVN